MDNKIISECIETREKYVELLKKELMGPGSEFSLPDAEHEIITDSPATRYSMGILFPRDSKMNADNDDVQTTENTDEEAVEENETQDTIIEENSDDSGKMERADYENAEEENLDEEIALASQNKPSSFGITFLVDTDVIKLECEVEFGKYKKTDLKDCKIDFPVDKKDLSVIPSELDSLVFLDKCDGYIKPIREFQGKEINDLKERDVLLGDDVLFYGVLYKLAGQIKSGFVRVPCYEHVILDFSKTNYVDCNKNICGTSAKITAVKHKIRDGMYSVTVMMVNDANGSENYVDGTKCIFQPKILIRSSLNTFKFIDYAHKVDFTKLKEEEQSLAMRYRNKKVYATGLGVSSTWEIDNFGDGYVATDFFPEIEIPQTDFDIPKGFGITSDLSMRYFSDLDSTDKEEKITKLKEIVEGYLCWIDKLQLEKSSLEQQYQNIAAENIKNCRLIQERMQKGINVLENDPDAWDAFQLANRAMFMQRVHLRIQSYTSETGKYPGDEKLKSLLENIDYRDVSELTNGHKWRLFQIAFILMSVLSIVDDKSPDRDIVDLIWFPTGGGKTEAYLGLIAFTIFYRRLAHMEESMGTAVIMRYTLRLLTSQQFTRASTLICACECIRRDAGDHQSKYGKYLLGDEPITIGLWIGSEHVPNTNDKAKQYLDELKKADKNNIRQYLAKYNKFQVLKCPWCGTKLIKGIDDSKHLVGEFGYRIGKGNHFRLFCPQDGCFEHELPVQIIDEELYEKPPTLLFATVDKFAMMPWNDRIGNFLGCSEDHGNRAPELIIQDELHLISGPLGTMVGLYETALDALCNIKGVSPKIVASTATIRRAKEQCNALYNRPVSQFPPSGLNSDDSFFSKELVVDCENNKYGRRYVGLMPAGKTKAMMEVRSIASLLEKIELLSVEDLIKDKFWTLTIYFNSLKDLAKCTNLVKDDIPDNMNKIANRNNIIRRNIFEADELTSRVSTTALNETLEKLEKVEYSKTNIEHKQYASNVVLATNMISVGIDIARLNVMLLVGQPKLTSEYIQASSRIGRSFPGVAFVMYDGTKSRDRSHYEQFKSYHESFYRYVEPTGVTPFSQPARDRALHAIVVTMMRAFEPSLREENCAINFSRRKYDNSISRTKKIIIDRANQIVNILNPDMKFDKCKLEEEIDNIFDRWESCAKDFKDKKFSYGMKYMFKYPAQEEGRLLTGFGKSDDNAYETMTSMRNVDISIGGNVLIWEDEK